MNFLRKLFDTSKRDVDAVAPVIVKINDMEPEIEAMSDDQLRAKGPEFRQRFQNGETLDSMLPEVFAVVREISKRLLFMRQFDVQLIGGAVLHQGRIAEMKTGEGKTLVAVAPMVLNAITGRGSHLVTVNDYLARRDAVWMGPVYHFLGFTVGIIQGQSADSDELGGSYFYTPGAQHEDPRYLNLTPCSRREAYNCDIVYGTNHEFGFDYLRDNMSMSEEQLVMKELHFAIIDEVDSILIDEARTPHIISGPSMEDTSVYDEVDVVVRQLEKETHYTADKKNHSASMTEEGMDKVEELLDIDNIASDPKLMHHVNAAVQAYALFDRDIDYVVRGGEVVIVDENTGRMMFGRRYGNGLHQALEAKERVPVQRESQTIATITFQNLFRLYEKLSGMTGTAKTEEDEFRKIYGLDVVTVPTNRPMTRQDLPDIVYKTQEAKFRGVGWEILRLYSKQQPVLVGTRSIEMSETVSGRLSAEMLQKLLIVKRLQDRVEVKKDIKGELKDDAKRIYESTLEEIKRPELAMYLPKIDLSADVSKGDWIEWALNAWELPAENKEFLSEALSHGIPHNLLNAKYHEREALIIAEAGRKGQVTIATNMAGRGVDILLGGRIDDELVQRSRAGTGDAAFESAIDDTFKSYRRGGIERAAPPLPLDDTERRALAEEVRALGGLFILGTERHESRRIDNQLRGRAGRQGDPGISKFYVSLEDTLWKIFNANMMDNPVLKMWPPMEEVTAGFLSRMIQKTQERIENHFFEGRKHTLEYDDVLNAQREHIYGMRRETLLGKDMRPELRGYIREIVGEVIQNAWMIDEHEGRVYDYSVLYEDLNEMFPLIDYATIADLEKHEPGDDLIAYVDSLATQAYDAKIENLGDEVMKIVENQVMLRAVNDRWQEHLQTIEYIREGINLRSYAQVDPLVAYKRETFDTFNRTLHNIKTDAVRMIFRAQVNVQPQVEHQAEPEEAAAPLMMRMEDTAPGVAPVVGDLSNVDWKKVGRNDLCPCGSGKKFKSCHYPILRETGVL
jgi:preprotein translocase subunit SecA